MSPRSIYPGINSAPVVKATLCIFKATPSPQTPPNPVLYCYLHFFCHKFLLPKQSVSECRSPAQLYYGCPVPVKAHPKTVKRASGPLPVLPDTHSDLSVAVSSTTAVVSGSLLVCLLLWALGTLFFLPLQTGGSLTAIRRLILDSFQAFAMRPSVSLPMPHC